MPLFGMDKHGNVYEENSDSKKAKKKYIEDSEQGSVRLGDISKKQADFNKAIQKKAHDIKVKNNAIVKAKILKDKKIQANQAKLKAIKEKKILLKNKQIEHKKNVQILKGSKQSTINSDYNSVFGNPLSGFEQAGRVVQDNSYGYNDLEVCAEYGGNTTLGGHSTLLKSIGRKIDLKNIQTKADNKKLKLKQLLSKGKKLNYNGFGEDGCDEILECEEFGNDMTMNDEDQGLGGFFSSVGKSLSKAAKAVNKAVSKATSPITKAASAQVKNISSTAKLASVGITNPKDLRMIEELVAKATKATQEAAKKAAKEAGNQAKIAEKAAQAAKKAQKLAGKALTAPIAIQAKIIQQSPLNKTVEKLDAQTGGVLASTERLNNLGTRFIGGEKVSKADWMQGFADGVKLGAIATSGGTAGALMVAQSSALKQVPLVDTPFGKKLIAGAVLAGNVYASGGVGAYAQQQLIEKVGGKDVKMVMSIVNGAKHPETLQADITKKVSDEVLKKHNLANSIAQAALTDNANRLNVAIAKIPDLSLTEAQRMANAEKVKQIESLKVAAKNKVAVELNNEYQKILAEMQTASGEALAELKNKLLGVEKKSTKAIYEAQLLESQASLKYVAAVEGRYHSEYGHPMLKYSPYR